MAIPSAIYQFLIAGIARSVAPGWSIKQTANGRNAFTGKIESPTVSYRPALDSDIVILEGVTITTSSVANPSVITTNQAHGIVSGQKITIAGHSGSTPSINGDHIATRISATTFSIPVNVTGGGTGGTASRRLFGGTLVRPKESGFGGWGAIPIETSFVGSDYNAQAERRFVNDVFEAGITLKDALLQMAAYCGFTLDSAQATGPTFTTRQKIEYMKVRDILDQWSVTTGYVWEWTEFNVLRMWLPSNESAPFSIITGDNNADGDITVEPQRTTESYANKIILRYSNVAVAASAYLEAGVNFLNNETVTVAGKQYTFKTTLTNTDGFVKIGANTKASLENLAAAIRHNAPKIVVVTIAASGGAGTRYASAMTANPTVTALVGTYYGATMMKVMAVTPGAAGNSIAVAETAVSAFWRFNSGTPVSTLQGGEDQSLAFAAEVQDDAEIAAHDIWEKVVEAANVVNPDEAIALATAYLATTLPVPKKVTYQTYQLGIRPGQMQTIDIAARNINGSFLITDVDYRNTKGNLVLRSVTAIESSYLQSVPRWRDKYKEWSGGKGTSGLVALGNSGGNVLVNVAGSIYGFGGSSQEWKRTTSGAWIAASSIEIRIDSSVRGSLNATVYVRLRAKSGNVTARLRNVTDGSTAGTSAAITNTNFEWTSFPVTLTSGSKYYAIEISPSVTNEDIQMGAGYLE